MMGRWEGDLGSFSNLEIDCFANSVHCDHQHEDDVVVFDDDVIVVVVPVVAEL